VSSSIALGLTLIVSIILGWLAAGRALAPVGRLTARAQRLSEDNLNERIDLEGPRDELTELADTLDGMLSRLETAFNAQRRFAANVSHEVRTPLAIMRGEADLALADPDANERERQFALAIRDNVDRTEALLESLLALSRSESAMNESQTVDFAELTGDVVSHRIDAADAARLHVDLQLGAAVVEGDPWLLDRLVANLVDNAINHNVDGGWLTVSVDTVDSTCFLPVSNSGDVLTAEQVESIMQPFRRAADNQRPGYGLGMTIVQAVAKAHGGSVAVEPRSDGGLEVIVELPASTQPLPAKAPSTRPTVPA
jgi:signal transduction histidine kinase